MPLVNSLLSLQIELKYVLDPNILLAKEKKNRMDVLHNLRFHANMEQRFNIMNVLREIRKCSFYVACPSLTKILTTRDFSKNNIRFMPWIVYLGILDLRFFHICQHFVSIFQKCM